MARGFGEAANPSGRGFGQAGSLQPYLESSMERRDAVSGMQNTQRRESELYRRMFRQLSRASRRGDVNAGREALDLLDRARASGQPDPSTMPSYESGNARAEATLNDQRGLAQRLEDASRGRQQPGVQVDLGGGLRNDIYIEGPDGVIGLDYSDVPQQSRYMRRPGDPPMQPGRPAREYDAEMEQYGPPSPGEEPAPEPTFADAIRDRDRFRASAVDPRTAPGAGDTTWDLAGGGKMITGPDGNVIGTAMTRDQQFANQYPNSARLLERAEQLRRRQKSSVYQPVPSAPASPAQQTSTLLSLAEGRTNGRPPLL